MTATSIETISRRLGVTADAQPLAGSMSGSSVTMARRQDGSAAVLKVTRPSTPESTLAADRELQFYRDIRPGVGIRTPELLAHLRLPDATALLLSAHRPSRPAPEWTERHWLDLAADLAVLHQTSVQDGFTGTAPPVPTQPASVEIDAAETCWAAPDERRILDRTLGDLAAFREQLDCTAEVLVHGDCHTDNILFDSDGLVWTDWQATGLGRPAADLAFCSVRAIPSGADPPLDRMVDLYARRRGLPAADLRLAVIAAELLILLLAWPPYAVFNDTEGVRRIHRRVRDLGRRWFGR